MHVSRWLSFHFHYFLFCIYTNFTSPRHFHWFQILWNMIYGQVTFLSAKCNMSWVLKQIWACSSRLSSSYTLRFKDVRYELPSFHISFIIVAHHYYQGAWYGIYSLHYRYGLIECASHHWKEFLDSILDTNTAECLSRRSTFGLFRWRLSISPRTRLRKILPPPSSYASSLPPLLFTLKDILKIVSFSLPGKTCAAYWGLRHQYRTHIRCLCIYLPRRFTGEIALIISLISFRQKSIDT